MAAAGRPDPRAAIRLVYVVDEEAASNLRRLEAVLAAGVTAVWLRAPGATGRALYDLGGSLLPACRRRTAALVIGDRPDVALSLAADGVQLGHRAPPIEAVRGWFPGWIGLSCHEAEDLRRAEAAGADWAVLSPVYDVPGKGRALGLDAFAALRRSVGLPVVALGGITSAGLGRVLEAGADGVAVVRALRDAAHPSRTARALSGGRAAAGGGPVTGR